MALEAFHQSDSEERLTIKSQAQKEEYEMFSEEYRRP